MKSLSYNTRRKAIAGGGNLFASATKVLQVADEKIERMTGPKGVALLRSAVSSTVSRGLAPDGKPWARTVDGRRALIRAMKYVYVYFANGAFYIEIEQTHRVIIMHSYGAHSASENAARAAAKVAARRERFAKSEARDEAKLKAGKRLTGRQQDRRERRQQKHAAAEAALAASAKGTKSKFHSPARQIIPHPGEPLNKPILDALEKITKL